MLGNEGCVGISCGMQALLDLRHINATVFSEGVVAVYAQRKKSQKGDEGELALLQELAGRHRFSLAAKATWGLK